MKLKYPILFLFLLTSCAEKTNTIYIEISPGELRVNQKTINLSEFEKELEVIVKKKEGQGFKRGDLVVDLKVDVRTKRGDIADIETSLRRLNIRKVIYSTLGDEQT